MHSVMPAALDRTIVYWHRELPPRDAEPIGAHTIDAASTRVPDTVAHRGDLWNQCYRELMERVHERMAEEIARLGGDCAHVLSENIAPRHDDRTGEAWMYGRFDYELYRRGSGRHAVAPADASGGRGAANLEAGHGCCR